MINFRVFLLFLASLCFNVSCKGSSSKTGESAFHAIPESKSIIVGADQFQEYLPLIRSHSVAIVANQTSRAGGLHLVDKLLADGVKINRVFAPEHGFRGEAGPGDDVNSGKDADTGLPVVSLYGSHKKPLPDELKDVDFVIFDIQDVGARFYTFISTLHYVMEACAENHIKLIILDRPNPNGFYIDGPVLDTAYRSFVGIAPIPIVHGLTFGEYALMANGEGWLKGSVKCDLKIVKVKNYDHSMQYELPVSPSPNLKGAISVILYPALCLFEGTGISVGRGTKRPFEIAGFPGCKSGTFVETPVEIPGVIKDPPYEGQECSFIDFAGQKDVVISQKQLMIEWIVDMYKIYPEKEKFFNSFFDKLAGTSVLRTQIVSGMSANEIRKSWQPALDNYKKMRSKYLLYHD